MKYYNVYFAPNTHWFIKAKSKHDAVKRGRKEVRRILREETDEFILYSNVTQSFRITAEIY